MSKIAQLLRYHATNKKFARLEPFDFTEIKDEHRQVRSVYMNEDREYLLEARFFTKFLYASGERPTCEIVDRSRRMITEEIFGEYCRPLSMAAHLLDRGDYRKAQQIILDVLANFHKSEPMKEQQ